MHYANILEIEVTGLVFSPPYVLNGLVQVVKNNLLMMWFSKQRGIAICLILCSGDILSCMFVFAVF